MPNYSIGLYNRNYNLIGRGNAFTPVYTNKGKINFRESVVKQGKTKVPDFSMQIKNSTVKLKALSHKFSVKAPAMRQPIQRSISSKSIQRFKSHMSPSPKIKSNRSIKPPSKGRGR